MKQMFALLLAVMATSPVAAEATRVTPGEEVEIMKQMTQLASKFNAGDYTYSVSLAPPSVFTISGIDKQKVAEQAEQLMTKIKASGFTFKVKNLEKIIAAYTCKSTKVVFIQTHSEIENSATKVVSATYMIASRDNGSGAWYFADGTGMPSRTVFDQIYGCNGVTLTLPQIKNETIAKKKP